MKDFDLMKAELDKKVDEACDKAKSKKGRCWEGYKPVPGKKPYSEDSCVKKSKYIKREGSSGNYRYYYKQPKKELGPRPSPDKISFDDSCFKKVGEKQYWTVQGSLAGGSYPKRFDNEEEAKEYAKRSNQKVYEHKEDIKERISWTKKSEDEEYYIEKAEKPFHGYNKKRHSPTGGLNAKFREKYNREHGSNLKAPVTEKNPTGKKAARRRSFCARMSGMPGPTSKDGKHTPKGAALKRWRCSMPEDSDLTKSMEEVYEQMNTLTDSFLKSSEGEGSRGGKVIGHTKSGKPIYDSGFNHPSVKDFTKQDHKDAANLHSKVGGNYFEEYSLESERANGEERDISEEGIKNHSKAEEHSEHNDAHEYASGDHFLHKMKDLDKNRREHKNELDSKMKKMGVKVFKGE